MFGSPTGRCLFARCRLQRALPGSLLLFLFARGRLLRALFGFPAGRLFAWAVCPWRSGPPFVPGFGVAVASEARVASFPRKQKVTLLANHNTTLVGYG